MSRNDNHHDNWSLDCKVYIGDLGYGCAKQELEEKFSKYGPLRNVWVARKPPGFAFVEFEERHDAEDAVRAIDGSKINDRRVRVEMSSGRSRWGNKGPGGGRGGGRDSGRDGGRDSGRDNYRDDYRQSNRGGGGDRGRRRSRSRSGSGSPRRRSRSRS